MYSRFRLRRFINGLDGAVVPGKRTRSNQDYRSYGFPIGFGDGDIDGCRPVYFYKPGMLLHRQSSTGYEVNKWFSSPLLQSLMEDYQYGGCYSIGFSASLVTWVDAYL